jgi:hypothetical protein
MVCRQAILVLGGKCDLYQQAHEAQAPEELVVAPPLARPSAP